MVNCFYVMARMQHLYKFTISRRCRRAHKAKAVSDWLKPNSLGIMSAFGYIDNLA